MPMFINFCVGLVILKYFLLKFYLTPIRQNENKGFRLKYTED